MNINNYHIIVISMKNEKEDNSNSLSKKSTKSSSDILVQPINVDKLRYIILWCRWLDH